MERRTFLRLALLFGGAALAEPSIETLLRAVQFLSQPETLTPHRLNRAGVVDFLTKVSLISAALPKKQLIKNDQDLRHLADTLRPLYKKLNLTDYEGPIKDIHFQRFRGTQKEGLMAETDCVNGVIAISDEFIDPSSRLYAKPKLIYEVAHEEVHAVGKICAEFDTGDPYLPPPNTETTPTLAGLETLAYLAQNGNEMGKYGLWGGLQEMAYRSLVYVAIRDDNLGTMEKDVASATRDDYYRQDIERITSQLKDSPERINPLYSWSRVYGGAVLENIYSQKDNFALGTSDTYKFDQKSKTLAAVPLYLPYLTQALSGLLT